VSDDRLINAAVACLAQPQTAMASASEAIAKVEAEAHTIGEYFQEIGLHEARDLLVEALAMIEVAGAGVRTAVDLLEKRIG